MELDCGVYKEILYNLFEGVCITDNDRKIIYWNKGAERLTGFTTQEITGKHCSEAVVLHIDKSGNKLCATELCPAMTAMKRGQICEEEVHIHHKEGHQIPALVRVYPLQTAQKKVIGAVEIFSDNSPKLAAIERIEELQTLALLDPLTELGNRRYAETNLHAKLSEMKRYGWDFGVLFIDIDHFKKVNDTYGHEVGDRVLRIVAHTLASNSRPFDIFGRWGGEEFIGIMTNVNEEVLYIIAERLRILVEQSSLQVGASAIRVSVSIGATLANGQDTTETLLRRADQLMYRSKKAGLNCVSTGL